MKIIIIDDEPLARSVVREYLEPHTDLEIVAECENGFEGVKAISTHKPDLIFLDIQMPKLNGFEMLELLDDAPAVIFTTAFDEYALKAFDTHAVDYLLKPFSQDRFDKAIEKYKKDSGRTEQKIATNEMIESVAHGSDTVDRIVIKTAGKIRIIPISQVLYLEAADDYVKVYTSDGSFLKNKTMSFYESHLPVAKFIRCHRSYIINIEEITRIDPYEKESHLALLRSGVRVPVSKGGYAKLRRLLGI